MKRRQFITILGGAAAWPLAAEAQQPALPVIGILGGASAATTEFGMDAFRAGLGETGFVVGRNVTIESRWADGHYDQLPALAAELVERRVSVIVTLSGTPTAQAAKAATSTIPTLFILGSDPVAVGLVASIRRPGGNITGATNLTIDLGQKRLEVLHELVPNVSSIAWLANPANLTNDSLGRDMDAAAKVLGIATRSVTAQADADLVPAFETIIRERLGALVVGGDPFHLSRRNDIVALAARYKIPATYYLRDYVAIGGLTSYGSIATDSYRQVGAYAGRILKGEKPADLPVLQPTRFELVINLTTAKSLGITVPLSLLTRADELVE